MKTVLFLCTGNYYRSRFAEIFFNWHAQQHEITWRADSRGLALNPLNPGKMSRYTVSRLVLQEIPVDQYQRNPKDLTLVDLKRADHIVAVKATEHRPLLTERFPKWLEKVEFWEVHDQDVTMPDEALPHLEREVLGLLERLKEKSPEVGKLSKAGGGLRGDPPGKECRKPSEMSGTTFSPGPTSNTVKASDGKVWTIPSGWIL